MRLGIVTVKGADGKWSVVAGPDSGLVAHRQLFKDTVKSGGNGVAEIQVWDSGGGMVRRKKFKVDESQKTTTRRRKSSAED